MEYNALGRTGLTVSRVGFGGGGIGLIFAEQIMSLAYDRAGTVVLGVVAMVLLGEYISIRIRSWLL